MKNLFTNRISTLYQTEANRTSFESVLTTLDKRLSSLQPFSLVRLGDGESQLLCKKYQCKKEDWNFQYDLWFGDSQPNLRQISDLRHRLKNSIRDADLLGIPELHKLRQHRRWLLTYSTLLEQKLLRKQIIADTNTHWYLQFSGWYINVLDTNRTVWIITCRDLEQVLRKHFPGTKFQQFLICGESMHPGKTKTPHWPNGFEDCIQFLSKIRKGDILLVGAGGLGKIYANLGRSKGAFSLDIGSVFDGWNGINSRNYSKMESSIFSLEWLLQLRHISNEKRISEVEKITSNWPVKDGCFLRKTPGKYVD